jgi:hypothetical protein
MPGSRPDRAGGMTRPSAAFMTSSTSFSATISLSPARPRARPPGPPRRPRPHRRIGDVGVEADRAVGRDGPGSGGPDDHGGAQDRVSPRPPGTSPRSSGWCGRGTRPRRRPGRCARPGSTSPAWSRDRAGPHQELVELADDLRLGGEVHGGVAVFPVAQDAQALELAALFGDPVDPFLAELGRRILALTLGAALNRQAWQSQRNSADDGTCSARGLRARRALVQHGADWRAARRLVEVGLLDLPGPRASIGEEDGQAVADSQPGSEQVERRLGKSRRYIASIQTAIATIIRFSTRETKPSGTLLSPPTQAHFSSRLSM